MSGNATARVGRLLPLAIAVVALVAAIATSVDAATITVPDDYPTIQQGVDAASPGGIVYVRMHDCYAEHVVIGKSITLQGESRETTIICGSGTGDCIQVVAAGVTISGFTVSNGNRGIHVLNAGNCVITDCIASGNLEDGIKLSSSTGSVIRDCDVTGTSSGYGVHLAPASNSLVENVRIFGNQCARPLNVYWSNGAIVRNVELFNNAGPTMFGFVTCTIEGLNIHDTAYGLVLNGATGCVVQECVISSVPELGLRVTYGSQNNVIRDNVIAYCTGAIAIMSPEVRNNRFYHNQMIGNIYQVGDASPANPGAAAQYWDDGYPSGGNYWSPYSGVDYYKGPSQDVPGQDGIGDTPYQFATAVPSQDTYPLMASNVICDPDPEYLTATVPTKTIAVKYLGGGGGLLYGYSVKFSWNGSVVSTDALRVHQGGLLSSAGTTFFHATEILPHEITVDCALLGDQPGVTGPGTMFTIDFTGTTFGTSPIDISILNVRDKNNQPLSGFYENDGLLIVDVSAPTVTNVFIDNTTLATDDYIKNTDAATVTAIVSDDDPAFGIGNIKADLSGLGRSATASPASYIGGVATWNLPSPPGVTCTPPNGTVTVTVTATDPWGNIASGNDTVIADNIPPTAVTGFDAAPSNEECVLSWAMGTDAHLAGVTVRRLGDGQYPTYAYLVANWPAVDAHYPATYAAGTEVYNGTGTGVTDAVVPRDIYYYQAFCYDAAMNYGLAASSARDLATNYWLGDVASTWAVWGHNGLVNDNDIDRLGSTYHVSGAGSPQNECDVGPTVHPDYHRLGLPKPDNFIGFEDLMVFAMNCGVVAPKVAPLLNGPADEALALSLENVGTSPEGDVLVALRLNGNVGDVKGLSAAVTFDASQLEFVSARLADAMLSPIAPVFFWHGEQDGKVSVDVAVLGTGVTIGGSGDVAVLAFRALDGEYKLDLAEATLRGVENDVLDAQLRGTTSEPIPPMAFRLVQNVPNPFNPMTTVNYEVPFKASVTIQVYDVAGREVRVLVDGTVPAGRHQVVWDGRNDAGESVGSGVYFCVMDAPGYHGTEKTILLR